MELTPSLLLGPGTPVPNSQGAAFGCWHHHQNPWVPNPIPRKPWAPNPKRQNLWAPNLSHWNPWVPNPSHRPNRPHLWDAPVGPGGTLACVWHLGEQKKRAQSVGDWGSTRSRNQKTSQWAKKKKIRKKKNNSLALTIPHKNVREIIKSICTAGGPRRRHHRQGTATKAQRDGLTPILGFGAVRGARVGPQKGSSGGWMDTGDC